MHHYRLIIHTHMPKVKLHSFLLAFLNIILPAFCTLISMIVKLDFQLQLKFCQALISNEINSRQSILYLIYRLIIIISSEMFLHESCNSAFYYHSTEFAFYISLQYNITRILKMLFCPKHSKISNISVCLLEVFSGCSVISHQYEFVQSTHFSKYHKILEYISIFGTSYLITPLQTDSLLLPNDALFRHSTHTLKSSFVEPRQQQLHIKHWERFSVPQGTCSQTDNAVLVQNATRNEKWNFLTKCWKEFINILN